MVGGRHAAPPMKVVTFAEFNKTNPPIFMGTESLDEVDNWVDTVETSFEMLDVPEEKKVIFGIYLLREYAKDWWKGKKILKFAGATMISWEEFRQEFEIEFRLRHLIEEAQDKFRDLV
ncbi:hypothetical protein ZOSMA_263G00070 [Zostera marina]|uniref:Retrotransposon gag domain-containing protein n=1 Tax=Zostera marina TaxID=29655 RepID=A0A0K9PH47_ZOSMR|nr:hypothetical protein ZOSMA_263G00070 [Zostera marina]